MNYAIIIKTKDLSIIKQVESFKKEDCLKAIAKALHTDVENLEQINASCGSGIFGVKEKTPTIENLATNPVSDIGYVNTLEVEYGLMAV